MEIYKPDEKTYEISRDDFKELEELVDKKYSRDSWNYCF